MMNYLLWCLVLAFLIGAFIGLINSDWILDLKRTYYSKSIWQFVSELGFMIGMILTGAAGAKFFIRQMLSGRRFSEISAFYYDEFNGTEKRITQAGIVIGLISLVGIMITH